MEEVLEECMLNIVRDCRRGDTLSLKVHAARIVNACVELTKTLHDMRLRALVTDLPAIDSEIETALKTRVRIRPQVVQSSHESDSEDVVADTTELSASAARFKRALDDYLQCSRTQSS